MVTLRRWVTALGLAPAILAACSADPAASDECGGCPSGQLCASDRACHAVCATWEECPICHECRSGLCYLLAGCQGDAAGQGGGDWGDAFDPCSLCGPSQVCVRASCQPACATGSCEPGLACVQEGALRYCVPLDSIQLSDGQVGGAQLSQGAGVRLRGALAPAAGRAQGADVVLVSP